MTLTFEQWPRKFYHRRTISRCCICVNIIEICRMVREISTIESEKAAVNDKHDYRGPSLKLCWDVINEVIGMHYHVSYMIWPKKSEYAIRFELSWKLTEIENWNLHFRISTSGELLNRKWYRKLMISGRCAARQATMWFLKFCCSLKIDGDIAISKFDLLFDLVT